MGLKAMSKIAIIYKSKYGSTEKYAQWISEEVKGDLFEHSKIDITDLMNYNTMVFGGGLYASGIAGIKFLTENYEKLKDKNIIVFTVGLASTDDKEVFVPIIEKNFTEEMIDNIKIFHLRGGIDYSELGFIHKAMMWGLKKVLSRKSPYEMTDDDKELLATYGKKVDFMDRDSISPMVSCIEEKDNA